VSHNSLIWHDYLRMVEFPRLELVEETYEKRILPAFEDLTERAGAITKEGWDRMMAQAVGPNGGDMAACAERAEEEGVGWFISMEELHWLMNGLFCVAIWHAVEQFLGLLYRRELAPCWGEPAGNPLWESLCRLYGEVAIHLPSLPGFEAPNLVRLVCHSHKHGPGRSLDALKERCGRTEGVVVPEFGPRGKLDVIGDKVQASDEFVRESFGNARDYMSAVVAALEAP